MISSVGMHHDAQFSFSPTEGYNKNITYRSASAVEFHTGVQRLQKVMQISRAGMVGVLRASTWRTC